MTATKNITDMRINLFAVIGLASALAMSVTGCSGDDDAKRDDEARFGAKNVLKSGCKPVSANSPRYADESPGLSESIAYKDNGNGYLHISHTDAMFNCESNINIKASVTGAQIVVNEEETNAVANCVCPYDLSFDVGPLEEGRYTVVVKFNGNETTRFALDYKPGAEGRVVVPQ